MILTNVYLYSQQTLIVLDLSSNQIQDKGMENLATAMEKNTVNSDLYNMFLLHVVIIFFQTLKTLGLMGNPSVLCEALEKSVTIRHSKVFQFFFFVFFNTNFLLQELKVLSLWGRPMGFRGAKYISFTLAHNTVNLTRKCLLFYV